MSPEGAGVFERASELVEKDFTLSDYQPANMPGVPNLSLDPAAISTVRSARCAGHVVVNLGHGARIAIHPTVRRFVDGKLDGRLPVTEISEGRIEVTFDVEDLSVETARRVGAFALALGASLGASGMDVIHRVLAVPSYGPTPSPELVRPAQRNSLT